MGEQVCQRLGRACGCGILASLSTCFGLMGSLRRERGMSWVTVLVELPVESHVHLQQELGEDPRSCSCLHEQDVLLLCRGRALQGAAAAMDSAGWWVARLWVWERLRCLCCELLVQCGGDREHRSLGVMCRNDKGM